MSNQALDKPDTPRWTTWSVAILGILSLSFGLAWVSSGFRPIHGTPFRGWASFLAIVLLGVGLLFAAWRLLRDDHPPRWLATLLVAAALLRLAAGVLWFLAMPVWGHGSPAEKAGYIMADAGARDQAAWKLAASSKPLWSAFQNNRKVDQYGGMLFLSALIYHYLGGDTHQPLLIVVLTAAFSSLAVLFTWALANRAWDAGIAKLAAWLVFLYPEAVLLGSSQMREAFTITLTVVAFYGLVRYLQERSWVGIAWIAGPLLFYLPFSPPFAALLLGLLALAAVIDVATRRWEILKQRRLWLLLGVLVVLVLAGLWLTLKQFTPEGMNNPLAMISWYLRKSAQLQAYLSRHASGWIQKIFNSVPEWVHLPLLLAYGVVQPFLPAAIVVGSHAPIWPWITLLRAVGWTFFLTFLLYAPFLAIRKKDRQGFTIAMILIVWVGILIASFRGGGDLWDNPRYRAAFAGLQAALVAWAWIEGRRAADPWLRRALLAIAAVVAWFIPWYLRRYTPLAWPVVDPLKTLGLGLATACLLCIWDWARTSRPRTRV